MPLPLGVGPHELRLRNSRSSHVRWQGQWRNKVTLIVSADLYQEPGLPSHAHARPQSREATWCPGDSLRPRGREGTQPLLEPHISGPSSAKWVRQWCPRHRTVPRGDGDMITQGRCKVRVQGLSGSLSLPPGLQKRLPCCWPTSPPRPHPGQHHRTLRAGGEGDSTGPTPAALCTHAPVLQEAGGHVRVLRACQELSQPPPP